MRAKARRIDNRPQGPSPEIELEFRNVDFSRREENRRNDSSSSNAKTKHKHNIIR
jgi:hypothetical protein